MPAAARKAGGDGLEVCRFGGSIDTFCQGLEITARVWSDRRQRCATRAGHTEHQQPRPTAVRHPAQGKRDPASGGAFGTGV
jgi:hypothetical protein